MAGSPIKRARRAGGLILPSDAIANGKATLAGWLPELLDKTMELARGVQVERATPEGPVVYKVLPNLQAIVYLIDRIMGKPAVEQDAVAQRLNLARAMFIEMQIAAGFIQAQVKDLDARGERALVELKMWPEQFVTEAQQQAQLQALAAAANKALLSMTPESFAEMVPGCEDPAKSLENLKGALGRDQAAILEEVMSGGRLYADEEDDGGDDDGE